MLRYLRTYCALALMSPEPNEGSSGGGGAPPAKPDPKPSTADDGGDDGDDDQPRFTQAQVDRMIAKRLAKAERGAGKTGTDLEKANARVAELEATLEDAKASGTSAEIEKARRELAKSNARLAEIERERDEHRTRAETLSKRERDRVVSAEVRSAMLGSGAHTEGVDDAVAVFLRGADVEVDEDGKITITIDGVPYTGTKSITNQVKSWIAARPHFQKSTGGGSGSRSPNGSGPRGASISDLSAQERIRLGMAGLGDRKS